MRKENRENAYYYADDWGPLFGGSSKPKINIKNLVLLFNMLLNN